jgi:hypothetical protein
MLIRDYYSTVPASLEEDVGGLDVIKQAWTRSRIESPRIRGWHAAGHPDLADHPVLRLGNGCTSLQGLSNEVALSIRERGNVVP